MWSMISRGRSGRGYENEDVSIVLLGTGRLAYGDESTDGSADGSGLAGLLGASKQV